MLKPSSTTGQRQRKSAQRVSQISPGQRVPQGPGVSVPDRRKGLPTIPRRRQEVCACAVRPAEAPFSLPPGAAHFLFDVSMRGPRRAPRGGERRSAQAHEVGAEVPLGCKGAGAVFAAGGNGAERTLRRRQWGAHPAWTMPPGGSQIPVAAVQRPAQPKRAVFIPPLRWKFLPPHAPSEPWRSPDLPPP